MKFLDPQREQYLIKRRKRSRAYYNTASGRLSAQRAQNKYDRKHPDKSKYRGLKYSSQRLGMPFLLTQDEFAGWFYRQEQKCTYCDLIDLSLEGLLANGKQMIKFSVDRKDSNLPYTLENICFSCWSCNRLKNDFFTFDEWRKIAQEFVKPRWVAKALAAMDKAA